MRYDFVRRYNPAYDFFLVKYFKQDGLEFGNDTTFDEVRPRWLLADPLKNPSPQEKLFCSYVSRWQSHPEARPCYYELFDRAIGGTGLPNPVEMRKLEAELTDSKMKLVFSIEDVAQVISDYYRRFLRDPLRQELEEGHGGREILKYFTTPELRGPTFGGGDDEKREAAWNEAAGRLVLWFDSITPRKIQLDIEKVFAEHEKDEQHVNPPNSKLKLEDQKWWCAHESELVALSFNRRPNESRPATLLMPARGYDSADHVIGLGWDIVAFPQYWVSELEIGTEMP
jgi:hypothetical protein